MALLLLTISHKFDTDHVIFRTNHLYLDIEEVREIWSSVRNAASSAPL